MTYLLLGLAFLGALLLIFRWFIEADPKLLVRVLKWLGLGIVVGGILFLVFSGRLAWAFAALPALLPWIVRLRRALYAARVVRGLAGGFGGGSSGGSGNVSDLETAFFKVSLDHASGVMTGEVIRGAHAGRRLESLGLEQLLSLLEECRAGDPQSARVLENFLDRAHPDWREGPTSAGTAAGFGDQMTRDEALRILGLEEGAGEDEIKEAYRRLMANLHPDHGGSGYLAAKINQAKDLLLRA